MSAHFGSSRSQFKESRRDRIRRWAFSPIFIIIIGLAVVAVVIKDAILPPNREDE
jgi:uncharacterized membrane protein YjgN (DUF898 family)